MRHFSMSVSMIASKPKVLISGCIVKDRICFLIDKMIEVITCLCNWMHGDRKLQYHFEDPKILSSRIITSLIIISFVFFIPIKL